MQTYIVKEGDTLFGISKQFGVPVEFIKIANNLLSNLLSPNQELIIPAATTTELYTVKPGDNLYKIALQYNTTVDYLVNLNKLDSLSLQIGQQLRVPISTSSDYVNYIVQQGENLFSIANKFNTTANNLKQINSLSSTNLSIGQVLKVPILTKTDSNTTNYSVKQGDNLFSIAKQFNTTPEEIKSINNLATEILSLGQIIKVPTQQVQEDTSNYTVVAGDSLYKIAQKFNITVDELIKLNNLDSTILTIGQKLKVNLTIPAENNDGIKECFGTNFVEPTYETYTVKKGDSLYSIASKFNTSVDNLTALNNLSTISLDIGQILKIKEII